MKVFLFGDYLNSIHGEPVSDDKAVCDINTLTVFPHGLIEVKGKLATPSFLDAHNNRFYIEYVNTHPKGESERIFQAEITCPHCGYEERDSWECSDEEDNQECGQCGSIFSYERNIEVTYSSKIVERNTNITKIS